MKKKLLPIQHFVVAIVLLSKGLDKIQHHHSIIGWTILLLGAVILVYFIASKLTTISKPWLGILIHCFESIALFLTCYVYFEEGKKWLPYFTLIAALGFLVVAFLHAREHLKHGVKHKV